MPVLPRLSTQHVLRWSRVKVSVGEPSLTFLKVLKEIFRTFLHERIVVVPTHLQGVNRSRRARKPSLAAGLIGEPFLLLVVTTPNVVHRIIDGRLGYFQPAILGRPKGHYLKNGH